MVRRLPVINEPSSDGPERSLLGWVVLGSGLCLALWAVLAAILLPLGAGAAHQLSGLPPDATVAQLLAEAPPGRQALVLGLTAGPLLLGFLVASGVSAYVVARLGPAQPARLGPVIGFSAAAIAWALGAVAGELGSIPTALFALAVLGGSGAVAGWLGARLGRRPSGV